MELTWYIIFISIGIGIFAGFINTLAGGGSLLTLPLLMFLGLPANVANGTNRIAIIMQNIVAVGSFKQQKVLNLKQGLLLGTPAVVGSIIGSLVAININEATMKITIGCLLVAMFFIILYKPDKWVKKQADTAQAKPSIVQLVIFFGIGLYGGFIQAGVGFFLLAALVLGVGVDLVKANALKLLIVLMYSVFALGVFIYNEQVVWLLGITVGIGNMVGALIGSRVAVSWGPKIVRIILLVVLVISASKLLGGIDYLIALFSSN